MRECEITPHGMTVESEWKIPRKPHECYPPTKRELVNGLFFLSKWHLHFFWIDHSICIILKTLYARCDTVLYSEAKDNNICIRFILKRRFFKGEVGFINYPDKPSRLILSDSGNMNLSQFSWLIWRTYARIKHFQSV